MTNLAKVIYSTASIILLISMAVSAQSLTFSDTHPVNNSDSLERWLTEHPTPNLERLKNLIAIERTYKWQNYIRKTTYLDTIEKLSKSLNCEVGIASANYLRGINAITELRTGAYKYFSIALKDFEKLKDISGQIHCYARMALINYDGSTNVIGIQKYAKTYILDAKKLSEQSKDVHDKLIFLHALSSLSYSSNNVSELKSTMYRELLLIQNNPNLEYGYIKAKISEALYYYTQKDFQKSANVYLELLKNIQPKNYSAQTLSYYNLGNDYKELGLIEKSNEAYKKAINSFLKSKLDYLLPITHLYESYRENAQIKHDFELANSLSDSLMKYEKIRADNVRSDEMVEMLSKNLLDKKEIEVERLKQRQIQLGVILVLSLFFLGSVVYFMLRLQRYYKEIKELTKQREQFYTIVAHDLRGPISSLSAISPHIRFLIKNKRDNELQELLANIEIQANKSILLLNNLLEWGIEKNFQVVNDVQEVDLGKVVREISEYYRYIIETQKKTLLITIEENIKLKLNSKGLEIVLRNLIDNAQKFTETGGRIEILVQKIIDSEQIKIEIRNTGQIKAEQLSHIKKVFGKKIKPEIGIENIGLGITLISIYTEKIGGFINVESSTEQGTFFTLMLRS